MIDFGSHGQQHPNFLLPLTSRRLFGRIGTRSLRGHSCTCACVADEKSINSRRGVESAKRFPRRRSLALAAMYSAVACRA